MSDKPMFEDEDEAVRHAEALRERALRAARAVLPHPITYRRVVFSFPQIALVRPGEEAETTLATPLADFGLEGLSFPASLAKRFAVVRFKVGKDDFFGRGTEIACDDPILQKVSWNRFLMCTLLVLRVKNVSGSPSHFRATVFGHERRTG